MDIARSIASVERRDHAAEDRAKLMDAIIALIGFAPKQAVATPSAKWAMIFGRKGLGPTVQAGGSANDRTPAHATERSAGASVAAGVLALRKNAPYCQGAFLFRSSSAGGYTPSRFLCTIASSPWSRLI